MTLAANWNRAAGAIRVLERKSGSQHGGVVWRANGEDDAQGRGAPGSAPLSGIGGWDPPLVSTEPRRMRPPPRGTAASRSVGSRTVTWTLTRAQRRNLRRILRLGKVWLAASAVDAAGNHTEVNHRLR